MSLPAIEISGLGKRYVIEHESRHDNLRDTLHHSARKLWRRFRWGTAFKKEEFWALRDLSFSVQPGEVVGIIGRNGAGKSTLLKILSRITEPTVGNIAIRGRVASLLEVGTGFHPELSGRENIYLNGAILGMHRAEIRKKFDEIVAFAEIERFLDTPVKRYSSGMYVRLAFAVAAHLEPEILIVDEVLSVGDAEFQKKCLGKIEQVATTGRTVLFVSHNMDTVDRLTSRCVFLQNGTVKLIGPTTAVLNAYAAKAHTQSESLAGYRVSALPDTASFHRVWTQNTNDQNTRSFRQGEPITICLEVDVLGPGPVDVAVVIENQREHPLFTSHLSDLSPTLDRPGRHRLKITLAPPRLRSGHFNLSLALFSPDRLSFFDVVHHFPLFDVAGTMDSSFPQDARWGDLYIPIHWNRA
ncbi:MAG TPA: ABC transporter ATP-binding protein [Rariglobus sp.]|jgi:lipopolysaccharide transport system ATP-binding protein|nr:ABC transporter ATP-binding protein [Rariglobus sp.]